MMGSWVRAPVGSQIITFLRAKDSIAQLVEHITFNDGVLGSSPSRVTKSRALPDFFSFRPRGEIGRLASLRGWCSQGRVGSNPIVVTDECKSCSKSGIFCVISRNDRRKFQGFHGHKKIQGFCKKPDFHSQKGGLPGITKVIPSSSQHRTQNHSKPP